MLIGHRTTIEDLKRLSKDNLLGHGYVFYGPSMVGKRTIAHGLANFLENKSFEPPVGEVVLLDAKIIVNDNAKNSIGIDAVREIKNFLWQKPAASKRRTLVIDEAELLTTEAQNALLKTTEEPPASSLLILVTSDIESILPTITSRLPKIYFGLVDEPAIQAWLVEERGLTKIKAVALAKRSLGKPGLASRLMDDKALEKNLELAQKYLKAPSASRKDVIKKIIDPDDFNLRTFLDSVIINLAWEKPSATRTILWHRALELYGNVSNFGLNPRLQLEALFIQ